MNDIEFVKDIREFEIDHTPTGYPCITMREVSRLCSIIEKQNKIISCKENCNSYNNGCLYVNGNGIHKAPYCIGFKVKD